MTKNFAHRGFSGKYPENTLLAFSKAIEEGVDGIENDVHLTKDGVLVVMHDELVDRTTNGKGYIKDKTYEELAQLDASYIFKEYGPQKVPTLREYLELVKDTDIITNIELKPVSLSIRVLSRKSMTCSENSIWWTALLFLPSIIIQSFV